MLTHHKNRRSHKDIVITEHSKDRAEDRIGDITRKELKLMAYNARYNGANIHSLNELNREYFNISSSLMYKLKQRFPINSRTENIYLYKGYVFVFGGKNSRVLKTVVNLKELINNLNKEHPQEIQYGF